MSTLPQLIEAELKAFDEQFPKSDGLYNTESGWRVSTDPRKIHAFLSSFALKIAESAKEETMVWEKPVPKSVDMTEFPEDVIEAFQVEAQGFNKARSESLRRWEGFMGKKEGR